MTTKSVNETAVASAAVELLKEAKATIEKLAAQLSTVKDMLPIEHPAQNQAAYDVEEICSRLETAVAGAAVKFPIGSNVICNGYPGVVTAVTSYGMVEVRMDRGSVLVDPDSDLTIQQAVKDAGANDKQESHKEFMKRISCKSVAGAAVNIIKAEIHGNGFYVEATCNKVKAVVAVYSYGLQVVCQNASHRVWKGSGKFFSTTDEAIGYYRSAEMKAIIQMAICGSQRN